MGLRDTATADAEAILSDSLRGFGWPISLTGPSGLHVALTGFVNDVAQVIDPDTEIPFMGRVVQATLLIKNILDAGLTMPVGVEDGSLKPWVVQFNDINGNVTTWKVMSTRPDRTLGVVILDLSAYEAL